MKRRSNGKMKRRIIPRSKNSLPGRKGVYDHGCPERANFLCRLGLTNDELAIAFGVSHATIDNWIKSKPDFANAIRNGKDVFDTGVQDSLLQRALGFEYDEIKEVEGVDGNGQLYTSTTTTRKKVLGDVTAMIFWLKNRHKAKWADVHKADINHKHSGEITHKKVAELSLEELSEPVKNLLFELNMKQLSDGQSN